MQDKCNISVSSEISKSTAVASWSGFIYQGKVALYQVIKLLIEGRLKSSCELKVEHLDDFAIFKDNTVLFIHQVKSTQSTYRSSYKIALNQAADVISDHFSSETQRFFHVSVDLGDFSEHKHNGNVVKFFEYHNNNLFVPPDGMDDILKEMIAKYLDKNSLCNTPELIQYKLDMLNSLIANKVNFAHALNQKSSLTQYESTDATPIVFSEVVHCLNSEVLNLNDKKHLLFRFRNKFLQVIDTFAEYYEKEDELVHLSLCKKAIASLNDILLERLFLSLDPSNLCVEGELDSGTFHRYLNIINELPIFMSNNNLPHYTSVKHGKYIPSSIELGGISKPVVINILDEHISELRRNTTLLDILFEFDNLIVVIKEAEFKLIEYNKSKATHNGDCKDGINNNEFIKLKNKITKAKHIRFVSAETAEGEIN
jgi:hypothetical protein